MLGRAEPRDWADALALVAEATAETSVLVIDEFPYLLAGDPTLEGVMQTAWDRALSRVPLLVIVIGSAVSTMALLGTHARPLYGRLREMVVDPFTVAETGDMIGAEPAAAIDAHLIIGGYPRLAAEWQPGQSPTDFLRGQLNESTSPLVVVGERMLVAELPPDLQAGVVLRAIGAGSRTFAGLRERTAIHHSPPGPGRRRPIINVDEVDRRDGGTLNFSHGRADETSVDTFSGHWMATCVRS
ncbi:MAG: ATP-binding protein [Actinobacteria bacterium]|nr:ATP-binding protein [Actinomycetota bacterium]